MQPRHSRDRAGHGCGCQCVQICGSPRQYCNSAIRACIKGPIIGQCQCHQRVHKLDASAQLTHFGSASHQSSLFNSDSSTPNVITRRTDMDRAQLYLALRVSGSPRVGAFAAPSRRRADIPARSNSWIRGLSDLPTDFCGSILLRAAMSALRPAHTLQIDPP